MIIIRIAAVSLIFFLASCRKQTEAKKTGLKDWNLEIDQPIRQLEKVLSKTRQQQPRNYTISNIAFLYNVKLYLLFNRYIDKLPQAERERAVKQQQLWLKKRKKLTDSAYSEYQGGTLASYSAGRKSIEVTRKRIADVEKLIDKHKQ